LLLVHHLFEFFRLVAEDIDADIDAEPFTKRPEEVPSAALGEVSSSSR
jgi:hypothetical protein